MEIPVTKERPPRQHTAMATAPFDITKLLQAPKKWTPKHLEGLNIQNITISRPLLSLAMLYQQTMTHVTTIPHPPPILEHTNQSSIYRTCKRLNRTYQTRDPHWDLAPRQLVQCTSRQPVLGRHDARTWTDSFCRDAGVYRQVLGGYM